MDQPEPQTERARELKAKMSERRWLREVEAANRRLDVLKQVESKYAEEGLSLRNCLRMVAPDEDWSTYLNWRRRYRSRNGPEWERLVDERIPPPETPIEEEVVRAACDLRRANRSLGPRDARQQLIAQFGTTGEVSEASLRRIWAAAGVGYIPEPEGTRGGKEEVARYNGGGGLALIGAAECELGVTRKLAVAGLESGIITAESQQTVDYLGIGEGERNERGQFTESYNRAWREGVEPGESDHRWDTDSEKRRHRELKQLDTLKNDPEIMQAKMLCMGLLPLITERRGFDGLTGPAGEWLELLGGHAYMPATLDKTLTELALLNVGEALCATHGEQWHEISRRWTEDGPPWLRFVAYVDSTQDPYWTQRYAVSGKVSRINRVMPCLSRVAVASGPGVPLVVETHAGTVSLKTKLIGMLNRLDKQLGKGEVGRLLVVDAEAATAGVLNSLAGTGREFISVLKGAVLQGTKQSGPGEWQSYRERDGLRELEVLMRGKDAPENGVRFRAVEMRRSEGRRPHSTVFVTNSTIEDLPTESVVDAYLSRWPHQEAFFRNGRNGGGLNRSHGYGGEYVTHVALQTEIEQVERRLARVKREAVKKLERVLDLSETAYAAREKPTALEAETIKLAEREHTKSEKAVAKAQEELDRCLSTPREIYVRDTTRDNIVTYLKLNALLLVEYVLKEYFGDLAMEWRTFIEEMNLLPVTVRTNAERIKHQIHANPRNPRLMDYLRNACEEINQRNIRRGDRLMRYEVVEVPTHGS
jgi:hypothetical protein